MPLRTQRVLRGLMPMLDPHRPPPRNPAPEPIVFGPRAGARRSPRPPVRIFLGSERGQFRAERVFLWSLKQHRDPGRSYEVYVMRHLAGFFDRFWLTGFTNYRFAVPALCNFEGRAIYNDVDQVYLTDPGELFDTPMGNAGFLSISERDTSVMLIDCARMEGTWSHEAARRRRRHSLEAAALQARLWGPLEESWNARDQEYRPGDSRLVHFTTLHTQPWRPFPEQFVYFENPTGQLWPELEAQAEAAGFMPVNADDPSPQWNAAMRRLTQWENGQQLLRALQAPPSSMELRLQGGLDRVPDPDLPWVLERLFAHAASLELELDEPLLEREGRQHRSRWFWQQQLEQAGRRHPTVRWSLRRRCGLRRDRFSGGPAPQGPVIALTHEKPGHDQQALALARALGERTGRPVEEQRITWSAPGFVLRRILGRDRLRRLPPRVSAIVASGWLPTRVARRVRRDRRLPEQPRLALLGRKAGPPPRQGGMLVQCRHFGFPCHPNRLMTLLPLNCGPSSNPQPSERWRGWLDAAHRIALLVGGDSRSYRLDADSARSLGSAASQEAREQQARLLVITSRRSGRAVEALAAVLRAGDELYRWQRNDPDNPYGLALAHADALIVTGESESMLADAVATGRPVSIWPLERQRPTHWERCCSWLGEHAARSRYNRRGTVRPQEGLSYLCARILERGWVLPPRDLEALHDALYYRGLAVRFGRPAPSPPAAFRELDAVARQLVDELGLAPRVELEPQGHGTPQDS